jgi:hypothetical protein
MMTVDGELTFTKNRFDESDIGPFARTESAANLPFGADHGQTRDLGASAGCLGGANRPDAACLTDGPANFAPGIGFARFLRMAPPETLSGSTGDR